MWDSGFIFSIDGDVLMMPKARLVLAIIAGIFLFLFVFSLWPSGERNQQGYSDLSVSSGNSSSTNAKTESTISPTIQTKTTEDYSTVPSLGRRSTAEAREMNQVWFDEISSDRPTAPIVQYEYFSADNVTLNRISNQEQTVFKFGFSDGQQYVAELKKWSEFEGGKLIQGRVIGHENSWIDFYLLDGGTIEATINIGGVGSFAIRPTPIGPTHIFYEWEGFIEID